MDLETEQKRKTEFKKQLFNFFSASTQVLTLIIDMEIKKERREGIDMELFRHQINILGNMIEPQVDVVDTVKQKAAKQEAVKQAAVKRRLEEDTFNTALKLSPKRTRTGRRY